MRRDQRISAAHDAQIAAADPVQLELDRRSCNEKTRFASKANARAKAKLTKRLKGSAMVYRCDVCNGWHVSSWTRDDVRRYRR